MANSSTTRNFKTKNNATNDIRTSQTFGSSTWTDVPNLSITIVPRSINSKFIIICSGLVNYVPTAPAMFRLVRGSTVINEPTSYGSRIAGRGCVGSGTSSTGRGSSTFHFVDSPSTTNSITYKIQSYTGTSSQVINLINTNYSSVTNFVVLEV